MAICSRCGLYIKNAYKYKEKLYGSTCIGRKLGINPFESQRYIVNEDNVIKEKDINICYDEAIKIDKEYYQIAKANEIEIEHAYWLNKWHTKLRKHIKNNYREDDLINELLNKQYYECLIGLKNDKKMSNLADRCHEIKGLVTNCGSRSYYEALIKERGLDHLKR